MKIQISQLSRWVLPTLIFLLGTQTFMFAQVRERNNPNHLTVGLGLAVFSSGADPTSKFNSWGGFFEYQRELTPDIWLGAGFESYRSTKDANSVVFDPERRINIIDRLGDGHQSSQVLYVLSTYNFINSKRHQIALQGGVGMQFYKTSFVPAQILPARINLETGELIRADVINFFGQENADTFGFLVGIKYGFHLSPILSLYADVRTRSFETNGGEDYHTFSIGTSIKF